MFVKALSFVLIKKKKTQNFLKLKKKVIWCFVFLLSRRKSPKLPFKVLLFLPVNLTDFNKQFNRNRNYFVTKHNMIRNKIIMNVHDRTISLNKCFGESVANQCLFDKTDIVHGQIIFLNFKSIILPTFSIKMIPFRE